MYYCSEYILMIYFTYCTFPYGTNKGILIMKWLIHVIFIFYVKRNFLFGTSNLQYLSASLLYHSGASFSLYGLQMFLMFPAFHITSHAYLLPILSSTPKYICHRLVNIRITPAPHCSLTEQPSLSIPVPLFLPAYICTSRLCAVIDKLYINKQGTTRLLFGTIYSLI